MNSSSPRLASVFFALILFSSLEAAPPVAPSDFIFARSEANDTATLEWVDSSNDETAFEFEITIGDSAPFVRGGPAADATLFTFTGFTPGSEVVFRLRAVKPLAGGGADELEVSDWSSPASVITENFNILASAVTATPGVDFSYAVDLDFVPDSFSTVANLPSWLSFEGATKTFTGENPPEGTYRIDLQAGKGIHERVGFIYINVINEGPSVSAIPVPLTLSDQLSVEMNLGEIFEDPDFIRAATVATDFGDIILGFYEGFPVTVENFFAYVDLNAWEGSFFHRMAKLGNGENFVLQGGGFKQGSSPGNYSRVTQLPAIVNEFDSSRPNFCGTISMAKLGGDPDSATNQFFISLNDNRSILDGQNGGFTVFGRAAKIEAANKISGLPSDTFSVNVDGFNSTFSDWPFKTLDETSPTFEQLVSMNDVVEIPTLVYSIESSGDDVVLAEVAPTLGAPLVITPTGSIGVTQLTITATDLDGARVSTSFPITVLNSYTVWAAKEMAAGPNEGSDLGSLSNFEEYAYGGDPNDSSDDAHLIPSGGIDLDGYGVFTFRHRDFASDLAYSVETSSDLAEWNLLWTTGDGFEADQVSKVEDDGEIKVLTIRSANGVTEDTELFFRLVVGAAE